MNYGEPPSTDVEAGGSVPLLSFAVDVGAVVDVAATAPGVPFAPAGDGRGMGLGGSPANRSFTR